MERVTEVCSPIPGWAARNQIQRVTTFLKIAASCRCLLFGSGELNNTDAQMPVIPQYNSTSYHKFKQECLTFLVSTQIVVYSIMQ